MGKPEGVRHEPYKFYGATELDLEGIVRERARGRIARAAYAEGLVIRGAGGGVLDTQWMVSDDNDDGTVRIHTASGDWPARFYSGSAPGRQPRNLDHRGGAVLLDSEGVPAELDADIDPVTLTVPDDDTWYTLVAYVEQTEYAPGTIDLDPASATVTGTGTRLTDLQAPVAGLRTSKILIEPADTAQGHAGAYTLTSITSDTEIAITPNPGGGLAETGVRFKYASEHTQAPSERGTLARRRAAVKLVARTRKPAANEYVLADVKRASGGTPEVQIRDRRHCNVARLLVNTTTSLSIRVVSSPGLQLTGHGGTIDGAAPGGGLQGLADTDRGTVLALWNNSTLELREYEIDGTPVATAVTVRGDDVIARICRVPQNQGQADSARVSHLIAVADTVSGAAVYFRFANGTTSSGSFTALPVANFDTDGVVPIALYRTKYDRIVLVCGCTSGGVVDVRYVYSDDFGATWQNNSGDGWVLADSAGGAAINPLLGGGAVGPDGTMWTLIADTAPASNYYVIRSVTDELPDPASSTTSDEHIAVGSDQVDITTLPCGDVVVAGTGAATDELNVWVLGRTGLESGDQITRLGGVQIADNSGAAVLRPRLLAEARTGNLLVGHGLNAGGLVWATLSVTSSVAALRPV